LLNLKIEPLQTFGITSSHEKENHREVKIRDSIISAKAMPSLETATTKSPIKRAAPSYPNTSLSECSTISSSSPTRPSSQTSSDSSWDVSTFPETSNLLPEEQNGTWRTGAVHAFKHPSTTVSSVNKKLKWPHVRSKISYAAEIASDILQDRLNHAFDGHDLPAIHDKILNLVPSVSLPTTIQVIRSMDAISDSAVAFIKRSRSDAALLDEEVVSDHLAFAHHMGLKARKALVRQGICHEWQILPTRPTITWQAQLDAALSRLFTAEKSAFSVSWLFSMKPVWTGDVVSKVWRLRLDTGLVEVVLDREWNEFEDKSVCLGVVFELPESAGCLQVGLLGEE
jgi:hypothetical protein